MTSPATGDDAPGSAGAGVDGPSTATGGDATFDPFRFGRPEADSPAAAAYPHLFPPQQFPPQQFPPQQMPAGPFPGGPPPPDPSSGYGYPPPTSQPPSAWPTGYPPSDYPTPGYPVPGHPAPGYPAPGYPNPGYGYAATPATEKAGNGRAVAGLILGICSVVFCFLTFLDLPLVILGVIFSGLGLRASKEGKGQRGLAVAGLTLSILGAVLVVAFTVFLLHQVNYCQQHHDQGTRAYNECIVHF